MNPADSWERLGNALLGPYERDILGGITAAYEAMQPKIEQFYKRAYEGDGQTFPLRRALLLKEELNGVLTGMKLPPDLAERIDRSLSDAQRASDIWARQEIGIKQAEAQQLVKAAELAMAETGAKLPAAIADYQKRANEWQAQRALGLDPPELVDLPGLDMAKLNVNAMVAAAQREEALGNYQKGVRPGGKQIAETRFGVPPALTAKGTAAYTNLNNLLEVDLRGRIIGAVEFHLAQGDSWVKLRKTLQDSVQMTKGRAQMVARTEMSAAMVGGTKLRYEAEGIEQVQWVATGSSRTCGICAPRMGKVYKRSDAICPAHPNCRCTLSPWDPKWQEMGIVDGQQEAKQRQEVLDEMEKAGVKANYGMSAFERYAGLENPPEPLWSPPRVGDKPAAPKPAPKTVEQSLTALLSENKPSRHSETTQDINYKYDTEAAKKLLDYESDSYLEDAFNSIRDWTGGSSSDIRAAQFAEAQRGGIALGPYEKKMIERAETRPNGSMDLFKAQARSVEDFITRAPKYEGTVYRGVGFRKAEDAERWFDQLSGGEKSIALESWSVNDKMAASFARGGDVEVVMTVKENRYGVPIMSRSAFKPEEEVVMPRGVRYRVANAVKKELDNGRVLYEVELEQLPREEKRL